MKLITFNLVNNSDRSELLKGALSINNQKKPEEITLIVNYTNVTVAIKLVI